MRHFLMVAIIVLSGCAQTGSALDRVVDKGAEANDETLRLAEIAQCRAASVGSVMRKYGATADGRARYRAMCPREAELLLGVLIDVLFGDQNE